jgi:hypothetical protein
MSPSRDEETEAQEQAALAAEYYKALLAQGIGFKAAQQFTVAWILKRHRDDGADLGELLGDGDGPGSGLPR